MPVQRPWLVTTFCLLIFIRAFVNMSLIAFTPAMRADIPFISTMTMVFLLVMFGFWTMRRWGFYVLFVQVAVFLFVKGPSLHGGVDPSILLYALGLTAGIVYFKRMS